MSKPHQSHKMLTTSVGLDICENCHAVSVVKLSQPCPFGESTNRTNCQCGGSHYGNADGSCPFSMPSTPAAELFPGNRSEFPVFTGALKYFPLAFAALAKCSYLANEQHNPGEPVHWAKHKSVGDGNQLLRHLMQAGTRDTEGVPHSWKMLWRAAEFVQRECEAEIAAGRDPFAIFK